MNINIINIKDEVLKLILFKTIKCSTYNSEDKNEL